ncbi:Uncharacterized protein HZ326_16576 [Fusarium oxysporum f. sp. albedinis]|nr:Uncharacterized protein HZ326_16576 [Fusarium oxysporum f. sp. albedinis]
MRCTKESQTNTFKSRDGFADIEPIYAALHARLSNRAQKDGLFAVDMLIPSLPALISLTTEDKRWGAWGRVESVKRCYRVGYRDGCLWQVDRSHHPNPPWRTYQKFNVSPDSFSDPTLAASKRANMKLLTTIFKM